ncbi:MAG: hypothetical protein M3220_02805 [Chloroflexota bacterium]|nr:hypothetical protein [Chloroflexota bacterium]
MLASQDDTDYRNEWLESISERASLNERLWGQCLESDLDAAERHIACHLIADLDEHGYLSHEPTTHAAELGLSLEEVEQVRLRLMHFEPLGIGARGAQECLRIQAESLQEEVPWAMIAYRLIAEQWDTLMKGDLRQAARALDLSFDQIEQAFTAIREHFHLYPAYGSHGRDAETRYLQPDVRFCRQGLGAAATIQIEVLEAHRYDIHIAPEYRELLKHSALCDDDTRGQLNAWKREVRHLGDALHQRWNTLSQVCTCIADFQRDFFIHDCCVSRLRPLTRDEIANALDVHPSTVGRTVTEKYAELPNRRVVPLSFFFESSAPIQALIAQLVADETALLSDETLRSHLHRAGWSMTRRAVSMHRESVGILPTHLRRRQRRLYATLKRSCDGM